MQQRFTPRYLEGGLKGVSVLAHQVPTASPSDTARCIHSSCGPPSWASVSSCRAVAPAASKCVKDDGAPVPLPVRRITVHISTGSWVDSQDSSLRSINVNLKCFLMGGREGKEKEQEAKEPLKSPIPALSHMQAGTWCHCACNSIFLLSLLVGRLLLLLLLLYCRAPRDGKLGRLPQSSACGNSK